MQAPEDEDTSRQPDRVTANPGFAHGQLARAFAASETHADPELRARATSRIGKWIQVLEGMLFGGLTIGSRTPVAQTPPWATLDVLHGGFATGELLAGGALKPHEHELLRSLPHVAAGAERVALNSYYLSDAGLEALRRMVASGIYRIEVPEEGALLAVVWLLDHHRLDQARALLEQIGPFGSRLRFYPVPAALPLQFTGLVHRQTVDATIRDLRSIPVPRELAMEREAVTVWAPLYDRVVALFAETVEGPLPGPRRGPDGTVLRRPDSHILFEGGWPCRHFAPDWRTRAQAALDDYRRLRPEHALCGKPDRPSENFTILRAYLEQCVADPGRLGGRDVGRIRAILGAVAAKRGLPGSERSEQVRQAQRAQVERPHAPELAPLLVERLSGRPQDEGLAAPGELLARVDADEAERWGVPVDQTMPAVLETKLWRSVDAPPELLVQRGVLRSGEMLARVVPQLSAPLRAAAIPDAELRRLYAAIYTAFRRRRSVLLLNLEHQVKLEELPWVAAIDAQRTDEESTRAHARQALAQIVTLALTAWPQQLVPNKLLVEIRALAEGAGLRLPIVDELAADIFMGTFTEKYLRAAQQAGTLLAGTLYERYYDIPFEQIRQLDDVALIQHGAPVSPGFTRLCFARAGESSGTGVRSVAHNGKVIEQAQILTTHNLAVLWSALELSATLGPRLEDLAQRCFASICRRQQYHIPDRLARLRMVKNTAYAWRQMVFFLALMPDRGVQRFVAWGHEYVKGEGQEFQARFRPALRGLEYAAAGNRLADTSQPAQPDAPRQFQGWTTEPHWLLPDRTSS